MIYISYTDIRYDFFNDSAETCLVFFLNNQGQELTDEIFKELMYQYINKITAVGFFGESEMSELIRKSTIAKCFFKKTALRTSDTNSWAYRHHFDELTIIENVYPKIISIPFTIQLEKRYSIFDYIKSQISKIYKYIKRFI